MFLRQAGLIADRKDGLRIYYRIKDRRVLQVLEAVNALARIKGVAAEPRVLAKCPCPKCGVNKRRRANSHN